jgi:DNA polymerase-3 subunit delta'
MVGSVVTADHAPPLPWLAPLLQRTLRDQHAHALLLQGPRGVGQFEMAVMLAQAWLCESEAAVEARPCGHCAACKLVRAHSHPDLLVLLPEALQASLGWATADADEARSDRAGKTKPSVEIKVDAVRGAVHFAQTTSARGHGKVVILHPAERMNAIAANTLLKTLEEPAGDARFILSCAAPDALLATIRSRCQSVVMDLPPTDQAAAWLQAQGVAEPALLLAGAGGQPQEVLAWVEQGIDAAAWARLPEAVRLGQPQVFANWPLPRVVDALQKLCHDASCVAVGAAPRYFPVASLHVGRHLAELGEWMRELNRIARRADHPWNVNLVTESLVQQGQRALGGLASGSSRQRDSLHSRA